MARSQRGIWQSLSFLERAACFLSFSLYWLGTGLLNGPFTEGHHAGLQDVQVD